MQIIVLAVVILILLIQSCNPARTQDAGLLFYDAGAEDGRLPDGNRADLGVADRHDDLGSNDSASDDSASDDSTSTDAAVADLIIADLRAADLASRADSSAPDSGISDTQHVDTAHAAYPDAAYPDTAYPDTAVASIDIAHTDSVDMDSAYPDPDTAHPDISSFDATSHDSEPSLDSSPADGAATRDGAVLDAPSGDSALMWPFSTAIPNNCQANPVDTAGDPWDGWANFQWPSVTETPSGVTSDDIYGQVWQDNVTYLPGQAPGWEGELAIGPYGSLPFGQGWCWDYFQATYNPDCDGENSTCGNNDEYRARTTPTAPGIYGLYYRFRPAGGAWRYGDLNGSNDGLQEEQAGQLVVTGPTDQLVLVTLNLRCRADTWEDRRPLVVASLARVNPDIVGFEEDCSGKDDIPQSYEIRSELSRHTGRGYEIRRVVSHQANHSDGSFAEGISVMSAHPISDWDSINLPPSPPVAPAHFQRKALWVDTTVGQQQLRFYVTHFEFGSDNLTTRENQALAIVGDLPSGKPSFVVGDLNATPSEPAIGILSAEMQDSWQQAFPADPGLTVPAWAPTNRIDYIFAPTSHASKLWGARLLDEHSGSTWLSDHRGVAAVFHWTD